MSTPPTNIDHIRECLTALSPTLIKLEDDSQRHAGHAGAASGGGHYNLHIVSAHFTGLSPIARHRLVYAALTPLMQREIHALSIIALAPDEASAQKPLG
ncbi:MAG TPA: BolA family protein [Rhodocyclaceae bacterium]|nr:BolA family protein [Rhodocyclaceae bacterium]